MFDAPPLPLLWFTKLGAVLVLLPVSTAKVVVGVMVVPANTGATKASKRIAAARGNRQSKADMGGTSFSRCQSEASA
jgi:hypothetical protein